MYPMAVFGRGYPQVVVYQLAIGVLVHLRVAQRHRELGDPAPAEMHQLHRPIAAHFGHHSDVRERIVEPSVAVSVVGVVEKRDVSDLGAMPTVQQSTLSRRSEQVARAPLKIEARAGQAGLDKTGAIKAVLHARHHNGSGADHAARGVSDTLTDLLASPGCGCRAAPG